jgi:transposase
MRPIALTAQQRKEIERRRKRTPDRRIYQRLTAALAAAAGHTPEAITQLLGVDLAQLNQWLRVFLDDGLETLCALADGEPSRSDG